MGVFLGHPVEYCSRCNYSHFINVIHATVANLNCVSVENFVQSVASGKVCVHEVEKIACDVCLNVFAKWGIEPNDIALSIPAGLMCYMQHVFQFMCEVAVS